jgi:hypothetical protein
MEDKSSNLINEILFDYMISSIKSYEDVIVLLDKIDNPELLKRQQKLRIVMKLIKYSRSYDEIMNVKDYYVKILRYPLTEKQVWRIIKKLVWASANDQQLNEVRCYARSKGYLGLYMKVLFSKLVAEILET